MSSRFSAKALEARISQHMRDAALLKRRKQAGKRERVQKLLRIEAQILDAAIEAEWHIVSSGA